MNYDWLIVVVMLAGIWVGGSQFASFFRARRTGVTYVGWTESEAVSRNDNPGLFARNVWSKAFTAMLMAIAVIWMFVDHMYMKP